MADRQLKVWILLPFFEIGGVERWSLHVRSALGAAGHEVTIISLSRPRDDVRAVMGGDAVVHRSLRDATAQMAHRRTRPDVVITALTKVNLLGVLWRSLWRFRLVGSVHLAIGRKANEGRIRYAIRMVAHWLIGRGVDHLIAVSEGVAHDLEAVVDQHKIVVLHNPCFEREAVRLGRALSGRARPLRIVAAGRLHYQKDFAILIDAFARARADLPHATLTIFGEGEDRPILQQQIERLGLSDVVTLPGAVADLPSHLQKADVFVLSSRYEGFGNVLAEALAVGCRCIAFDVPHGPREILRDGSFGTLIEERSAEALAHALRAIPSSQPSDHAELAAHLEQFSVEYFRARAQELLRI